MTPCWIEDEDLQRIERLPHARIASHLGEAVGGGPFSLHANAGTALDAGARRAALCRVIGR